MRFSDALAVPDIAGFVPNLGKIGDACLEDFPNISAQTCTSFSLKFHLKSILFYILVTTHTYQEKHQKVLDDLPMYQKKLSMKCQVQY